MGKARGKKGARKKAAKVVRLEEWSVVNVCAGDPRYTAPEEFSMALSGKVYGYPGLQDGTAIVKSSCVVCCKKGGIVVCVNRQYRLGRIDRMYGQKFPGARKKLFAVLPKV